MLRIQKNLQSAGLVGAMFLSAASTSTALADARVVEARDTVSVFKKADPGIEHFFRTASGYVVFSTVGKGALVVGGAGGKGILFEAGKAIGKASLAQVTVGLQLGGQAYSEIIFFENLAALDDFKHGNFALAAQVSAVALAAGASTNAKYQSGVAVFTATKTGLMYEASVGGQKFGYEAFPVQGSK